MLSFLRAVARRITGIEQQAGAGENNVRETWKYTERTVKDNDTETK
jgi:hypothetical protein